MYYGTHKKEVIFILQYTSPVSLDNMILSIDNIVLDVTTTSLMFTSMLEKEIYELSTEYRATAITWSDTKPGTFRTQYRVRFPDGGSFWIGIALNLSRPVWDRCRIEFNPNKVAKNSGFQKILQLFIANSDPSQRLVKRFDLAIDIPVDRQCCFLIKDRRKYIERRHGQEYTQYLGAKSSKVGRVKLYNKQIESELDTPLTRLELTLDPEIPFEKMNFPKVYYFDAEKLNCAEMRVTETERFIIGALLQGYGKLSDLGRKTRRKIELILNEHLTSVDISREDYSIVLNQLHDYLIGVVPV